MVLSLLKTLLNKVADRLPPSIVMKRQNVWARPSGRRGIFFLLNPLVSQLLNFWRYRQKDF
jgi:hypothetical protein